MGYVGGGYSAPKGPRNQMAKKPQAESPWYARAAPAAPRPLPRLPAGLPPAVSEFSPRP